MGTPPEFTEYLVRVQSDLDAATPKERLPFHSIMLSAFRHGGNLYYQFRIGMLAPEMWRSYDRTLASWLANPAWRERFLRNAACFSQSLQALIGKRVSALAA